MKRLYLDYNATTPLEAAAKTAMLEVMDLCGNASSTHADGRQVRQFVEAARKKVASYFNAAPAEVIFTSGATESNNLALKGFKGPIIASAIEHDSVLKTRDDIKICPVTLDGVINLDALEALLQEASQPCLVSVMAANNETGVVQPLKQIADLCQHYKAKFHCDAVQVIGKVTIDWTDLKIDMISLSAHKIGGPQGVGALIITPSTILHPLITGGGQERYFRSGTENVIGIVGFGAAIDQCLKRNWHSIKVMKDQLEAELQKINGVTIFGEKHERLPNTLNFTMPGVANTVQIMHFDLNGISVSAGSACSAGKVKTSHVLQAMKVPALQIGNSIRLSLGLETQSEDMTRFFEVWKDLYKRTHDITDSQETIRRIAQ